MVATLCGSISESTFLRPHVGVSIHEQQHISQGSNAKEAKKQTEIVKSLSKI